MLRKTLSVALAACLAALLSAEALAWGACHRGYTHVGPSGVTHIGSTSAWGAGGGFSSAHVSHYGACGSYHAGYAGGAAYGGAVHGGAVYGGAVYGGGVHYSSASYGGAYAVGGFHAVGVSGGVYHAGVYRRW